MDPRHVTAVLVVLAGGLLAWSVDAPALPAESAVVDVTIEGPDGPFWNGSITAAPATAFGALVAASEDGEFVVEWSGRGDTLFVHRIHDWSAQGAAGWCIQVDDGAGWRDSPVSAARLAVQDGWSVRWYWSEGCEQY